MSLQASMEAFKRRWLANREYNLRFLPSARRYRKRAKETQAQFVKRIQDDTLRAAADAASYFSMRPNRNIHPDMPWDEMNTPVQIAAHTTAQQICCEISDMRSTFNPEE